MSRRAHNSSVPSPRPASSRGGAELLGLLATFRERGRRLVLAVGICWLAAVTIAVSTLLVAAGGLLRGIIELSLGWTLSAVAAAVAVTLAASLLVPLSRLARLESVARRIGRAVPDLASDVLSAGQLALSPSRAARFSPSLLDAHNARVAGRLGELRPSDVFPLRQMAWSLCGFAAALLGAAAAFLAAPEVMAAGLRVLGERAEADVEPPRTEVLPDPVVGDMSVILRYPDYLGRPDRMLGTTSGGLLAPIGTTVLFEGRSLLPGVHRGEVALPCGRTEELAVSGDGSVRGLFVIDGPGDFFLRLQRDERLMEGPPRRLEIEPDRAPAIRLLGPVGEVEVDERGSIPLEFEAEDDHALSRVDLVLRGDGVDLRRTILRTGDGVRRLRQRYVFDLQSVRLTDAGPLQLELEAFDGDTIRGPKSGVSEPLSVRVMTLYGRHQSALEEQSRVLDGLVDLLAARMETPPYPNREEIVARERFVDLRLETEELLGRLARLIHTLGRDALASRRTVDTLVQVREDLSNQLLHEARHHRDVLADLRSRQSIDRVTIRLLEAAVTRVDDLLLDQQIGRVVSSGDLLARGRTELADLLGVFERTGSETARRAVLDTLARLDEAIDRLHREIDQVRGVVGDAYLNPGALERIDLQGILARIRELLAEGDIAAASRLAAEMELEIARVLAALESGMLAFRTERFGEGEKFVGDLLDRLLVIETEQIQVRRQTTALQRRYQERLMEVMRGKIDPLVRRGLSRVERIRKRLVVVEHHLEEGGQEWLVALRVLLRDLETALRQGDLEEARRAAEEIVDRGEDLPLELSRRLEPATEEARQVVAEVEAIHARPGQIYGREDNRQFRIQTANQRLVYYRARRLRAWIRGQQDETHFLASRALAALDGAAARMEQGVAHLEGKRARSALEAQTMALAELAKLREDLRRGGSALPIESRPVVLRAEVDIPAPGDYRVPPEFREDILEAMRDDLPASYREAIERYYETLVR